MLFPGEGNGTPPQYSRLENPMDGGAWWTAVHGVARSRTWLSDFTFTFHFHALEKDMAAPCSVLAWRIPGAGNRVGCVCGVARGRLKRLSSSGGRAVPWAGEPRTDCWCSVLHRTGIPTVRVGIPWLVPKPAVPVWNRHSVNIELNE